MSTSTAATPSFSINTSGVTITGGSIIGYSGPTGPSNVPTHVVVGAGGGGAVGGIDIMYDMEGVPLEDGQEVVVAFGNGVTGKLRIGSISEVRREQGEIVVTWKRGWDIPKRPSRIKVAENRILVVL